jgi:hypothetical protein
MSSCRTIFGFLLLETAVPIVLKRVLVRLLLSTQAALNLTEVLACVDTLSTSLARSFVAKLVDDGLAGSVQRRLRRMYTTHVYL